MFSFFKKKNSPLPEGAEQFTADLHSHLLPGLDDGSASMEDTLAMLRVFSQLGFYKVVTTPHVYENHYNNTPEVINEKLTEVRQAIKEAGIEIRIEAAAEYFFDEKFTAKVKAKTPLLSFGQNYVLFETPFMIEPINLKEIIRDLQDQGYNPILAHPERYAYLVADRNKVKDYFQTGVLFQINALSFIGQYDKPTQKLAEWMVENELVHFIGSDCHKMKHLDGYKEAMNTKHYRKALELPLFNHSL